MTFFVVGIDEVGCGALAGPVVAAACWLEVSFLTELTNHALFPFIRDSKTLSEDKREQVSAFLHQVPKTRCLFAFGYASKEEVEAINVRQASLLAMTRAYNSLGVRASLVVVDGKYAPDLGETPVQTIIRGDQQHKSISAASILAKVCRDAEMRRLHGFFPHYEWDRNKGYGTLAHRAAITKRGLTPHHRSLFCSAFVTAF
ncbi:MAG: ribonuclease HII [Holosporales bacterium]|jgi:ribonuclease HII|nr:ribonuclease HII [Holosporales bacterium]